MASFDGTALLLLDSVASVLCCALEVVFLSATATGQKLAYTIC